ncbi:MAG TPA: DNA polymerase, partial [Pyrinomonadaceae bacterium]|nr:DNA polymerase [Pyrinomonadaceae bacterium]
MEELNYRLIGDASEVAHACERLSRHAELGFDTETTSLSPFDGRLRLVQLAAPGEPVYVFDIFKLAPDGDAVNVPALEPLRRLLAATRPVKVAHNSKFDAKWVRHHLGVELCGEFDSRAESKKEVERGGLFDTLLASQLISAGEQEDRHSLASVAERYLDQAVDKTQQVSDWGGELSDAQLEYAARDAALMLPLRLKLVDALRAAALTRTAQLEFECVTPLAALELAGVYLDQPCWRAKLKDIEKHRDELRELLQDELSEEPAQQSLFGPVRADINLDSHVQLTRALKRVLPEGEEIPDSTRNWKLEPLAAKFTVVRRILDYRTLQKTLKFGETLLEAVNKQTGRIHSHFHQIGAPTGRMSCTDPNVQQVPHAFDMRRCFRAPEGRKLIDADYCVARGTRVATRRGLVRIEDARVGDEVYLEDGSRAAVAAVIDRGPLPVFEVKLKNGYALTATALHRVRVLDAAGDYVWRRIGELRPDDFVAVQPGRGLTDELPYAALPGAVNTHFDNNKNLRTPALADERLALFMGYLAGDGTFRPNHVGWVVNSRDADVARLLKGYAAEAFNIEVHHRGEYRGVSEFSLCSVPLVKWCSALGVTKEGVPTFLWESRPGVVAAYLRGLFEADGSVTDSDAGKVSFGSARKRLAKEVHQLLLALGIPATLRERRGTGPDKKSACWVVSVPASGLTKFREAVGFVSARKRDKLDALARRWAGKTVVGNLPDLKQKVRGPALSGEVRRLLNNTSSLGRPVGTALASAVAAGYPEVAAALRFERITTQRQIFLPVASIEEAGVQHVFDLSVPGPMTYISDGFVSHNSQIELRILADFTGDRGFVDAFRSGADLHRTTAAQVFNVKLEDVSKEQRDFAKRLNFGVVYGIGARRFALLTGLKESEAEDLLRRYFATYRDLDSWLRDAGNKAVRERTAPRTVAGRLFRFNFDPEDRQAASLAHRGGKNSPIQGCVREGTRVLTLEHGYVPIEDVAYDEVTVWDGRDYVSAAVVPSGPKQLVRLELWGGHYVECSPDHKFRTVDANGRRRWLSAEGLSARKQIYVDITGPAPDWELPFDPQVFEPKDPKLKHQPAAKPHNAKTLSLEAFSDRFGLGLWTGRLASDGSVSSLTTKRPGNVVLMVAAHEEAILSELEALTGTFGYFGRRTRVTPTQPGAFHSLTVGSISLTRQLLHYGIKERVPDFIWKSKSALRGYLRGMFDGDGTVNVDGP